MNLAFKSRVDLIEQPASVNVKNNFFVLCSNSTVTGTHQVPVFKGKPSAELLQQFTTNPSDVVLQQQNWSPRDKYVSSSGNDYFIGMNASLPHGPQL